MSQHFDVDTIKNQIDIVDLISLAPRIESTPQMQCSTAAGLT